MIFNFIPAFYLFALSAPVVLFYFYLKHRRTYRVSATFLWRNLRDREIRQDSSLHRRVDLLLIIQLLILAALILALARPAVPQRDSGLPGLAIVIDGSASMRKTDRRGQTLFEKAKDEASEVLDRHQNSSQLIYQFSSQPFVVSDRRDSPQARENKLEAMEPTFFSGGSKESLRDFLFNIREEGFSKVLIISDRSWEVTVPDLDIREQVLQAGPNVGIENFVLRKNPVGDNYSAFVRVVNYGQAPTSGNVSVEADDYYNEAEYDLGSGEAEVLIFEVPKSEDRVFKARLSEESSFSADNIRFALQPGRQRKVGWLGHRNPHLERAIFSVWPEAEIVDYGGTRPDIVICNRTDVPAEVENNLLLVNSNFADISQLGETQLRPSLEVLARSSPLLDGISLSSISVEEAPTTTASEDAEVVLKANDSPLLYHGQNEEGKYVSFSASLAETNLPSLVDFPILIYNVLNWLTSGTDEGQMDWYHPGDQLFFSSGSSESIEVTTPRGRDVSVSGDSFVLQRPGIYYVQENNRQRPVPVNVAPRESELHPEAGGTEGRFSAASQLEVEISASMWPLFAGFAAFLLLVESMMFYGDVFRWWK